MRVSCGDLVEAELEAEEIEEQYADCWLELYLAIHFYLSDVDLTCNFMTGYSVASAVWVY